MKEVHRVVEAMKDSSDLMRSRYLESADNLSDWVGTTDAVDGGSETPPPVRWDPTVVSAAVPTVLRISLAVQTDQLPSHPAIIERSERPRTGTKDLLRNDSPFLLRVGIHSTCSIRIVDSQPSLQSVQVTCVLFGIISRSPGPSQNGVPKQIGRIHVDKTKIAAL
jgi:hypothetical protein